MAIITKEEHKTRKYCVLKAHIWYGTEYLTKYLSNKYDIYIDEDIFYLYELEA